MPTPQSFQLGDIVMVRGTAYRIKGFRPVGGMQGLMVMNEPNGEGDHAQHIEFLRISDVAKCKSLASVA